MAKLRVGELMHAAAGRYGEVAPALFAVRKGDFVDSARRRSEPLIHVLRRDAHRHRVPLCGERPAGLKVNGGVAVRLFAVVGAHLGNAMKGNAHPHAEQCGGEVDA